MILISHRGNIDKINKELENKQHYVDQAILKGFDVEIDLWKKDDFLFLGHDGPETPVTLQWLIDRKSKLWIHCKNFYALDLCLQKKLRCFFHEKEKYTIISNNLIWAHDLETANKNCIIPLLDLQQYLNWEAKEVYGICSDFVGVINEKYNF